MVLTPFACIPKQNDLHHFVRVVYPDGRIESLSRSCSVYELLQGNPDYYVCGSTAHTITSRMGLHEQLEKGFTYFVCAEPNAQPFLEFRGKGKHRGAGWKISPRLSRPGVIHGREMRSPTHGSSQSRKVFDFHSATMQVEGMRAAEAARAHHDLALDGPPKLLRQLVFLRHCLQVLRLPRNFDDPSSSDESLPSPSPDMKEVDLINSLLNSAARCELGLYVSRRQESYLRKARKRRKTVWKPVLQSISEMTPVVEFLPPAPQQQGPDAVLSKRFSPPPPTTNISPPQQQQQQAPRAPPRNISPPRRVQFSALPRSSSAPRPPQQQHQRRASNDQRVLYVA